MTGSIATTLVTTVHKNESLLFYTLLELTLIVLAGRIGVISQPMFTMLVIMAIFSTVLTTPALRRYLPRARVATITG